VSGSLHFVYPLVALLSRLESVRFSQSLVPQTTATPLTSRDGTFISSLSIRCGNDLCAVARVQSADLYGRYRSAVSRLKTTGDPIDPPLSAITIAPPNPFFFPSPSSDWIGDRLFVAADRSVFEVDAGGSLVPLATVDENEHVVALTHSDQDLVMFIQRPAGDVPAMPRIFIRVSQARRHGAG
jgi:hypothetical protein